MPKWRQRSGQTAQRSRAAAGSRWNRAERDGIFYVGIERVEKIVKFGVRKDRLSAHEQIDPRG